MTTWVIWGWLSLFTLALITDIIIRSRSVETYEDDFPAMNEAQSRAFLLLERSKSVAGQDKAFRNAIGTMNADLEYLIRRLAKDPDLYRNNRSFFLVHLKSIYDAISLYEAVKESGDDEDVRRFLSDFSLICREVKKVRDGLAKDSVSEKMMEMDVIKSTMNIADEPVCDGQEASRSAGWRAGLEKIGLGGKGFLTSSKNLISNTGNGAGDVLGGLVSRGSAFLGRNVADPVSVRLVAAQSAAASAVVSGGIGTVILGVLCPPLIPLAAADAAMSAMATWNSEVERLNRENADYRDAQVRDADDKMRAAISRITGGATALRSETGDISFIVDAETGASDATILIGDYAGKPWSGLTSRQKSNFLHGDVETKTRDILRTIDILNEARA